MRMADIVLFSEAVFDSVRDEPFAGGVAICGDKIEFVGSRAVISKFVGPNTRVFDFGSQLIMPGFCDSHAHLEGASNRFCALKVQGLDKTTSEAECVELAVEFYKQHPDVKRITGMGWSLNDWGNDAPVPTKHSLDKYFPDIPVYLQSVDGHMCWLNSAAIEECGEEEFLASNPKIRPEWAPREADGSLVGFLREGASGYPFFYSIKVTPEEFAQYYRELIGMCSAYGITGFIDASMQPAETIAAFYAPVKALDNNGRLDLRIHMYPGVRPADMASMDGVRAILPYLDLYTSDMLHISGIKSQIDGITESRTGAMLAPYASDPSTKGEPMVEPEVINRWMEQTNALGFSTKLHCIGDYAVRMALDAFEAAGKVCDMSDIRNCVEHLENVDDADVPRFAQLGAIASFQPAHVVLGKGFAEQNLGMERFKREFRWRDIVRTGAHYALGTDAPVVSLDPFVTIYNAVTRLDVDGSQYSPYTADQCLTLAETLKGYTVEANYSCRFEHKCGTLEAGKYADIVVWDKNPFDIAPEEIKDCCAVMTISNGRIVYQR